METEIPTLKKLCIEYCIQNNISPNILPTELKQIIEKGQNIQKIFRKEIRKKELAQEFVHGALDSDARWKKRRKNLETKYDQWALTQARQASQEIIELVPVYPRVQTDVVINLRRDREIYLLKRKKAFHIGCVYSLYYCISAITLAVILINKLTQSTNQDSS